MPQSKEEIAKARKERRVHKSAVDILNKAVDILAAGGNIHPDDLVSAAIPNPVSGGRSMLDAQKFRMNWYQCDRKVLNRVSRMLNERNWFCQPVHEMNMAIYGAGFQIGEDASKWAKDSRFPFHQIHNDLLEEYLVNDCVCAFWKKEAPEGKVPMIEVPDTESVEYDTVAGYPQISVSLKRNRKIDDKYLPIIGQKMFDCIKNGKALVISKNPSEESEYDFEILKQGKTNACIRPPRITGIIDDLDFIEAVRCGDWNGAWSRREILRHTKKGSGVSSGPNAGTARNNATTPEIKEIVNVMAAIMGKTDLATNWDHEIDWLFFKKEFFGHEIVEPCLRRLVFHGGLPSLLLLKTDSQFDGLTSYAFALYRARVEAFRERFGKFLSDIFNSPSFRDAAGNPPEMTFSWSVKPLYSLDSFTKYTSHLHTYGLDSTPSLRRMFGINNDRASSELKSSHDDPLSYTPVFEPRQGIVSGYSDAPARPASNASAGEPGRPAREDG